MGQKMYYYTSTDTMSKILTGSILYATNLGYMNDSREYVNGLKAIKEVLKSKKIISDEETFLGEEDYEELTYFSISFCKANDLLSQWIAYARESGVSMEMEFGNDNSAILQIEKNDDNDKTPVEFPATPKDIIYIKMEDGKLSEEEKEKIWNRLKGKNVNWDDDYLIAQGKDLSAYIKQADFDQEQEFRIAINSTTLKHIPKICYRTDKYVLKPYLKVKCKEGWPVTSVMVGPGFNQDLVFQSIKSFLNHAEVKSSRLLTCGQWKTQIEDYFLQGGEKYKEIWNNMKNQDTLGFYNSWTDLGKRQSDPMGQGEKEMWLGRVSKVLREYVRTEELVKDHCFTSSGIILKKSKISYIY